MSWLKSVLIDIAVTIIIAFYVFQSPEWGYWIIVIYTPLMLLLKVGALTSGVAQAVKKSDSSAPSWFFHLLYSVNLLLFLIANWWLMAGMWAAIWILSAVQESKKTPKKGN